MFLLLNASLALIAQESNTTQQDSIQYLLAPRKHSPLTSILFRLRGGSSFEDPAEEGFAHLIEHLVYRGGSSRFLPHQFRRQYEPNLFGGYTNRNEVDFSMLVESPQTMEALADLWDAVFRLRIQTDAILQEISILLLESLEKKDSLGIWKTEDPEVLRNRVQQFYDQVFVPRHFQVVVVGEFDPNTIDAFFKEQTRLFPNQKKIRTLRNPLLQEILKESQQSLEVKMEDVLTSSEILYIQGQTHRSDLTVGADLRVCPEMFRQRLENKILCLYQGNPESSYEGLTLLLGGEGEKSDFEKLKFDLTSNNSAPFLKNTYVERDYLALVWGGPVGHLDIFIFELQGILKAIPENCLALNSTIISYSGPESWQIVEEKLKSLPKIHSSLNLIERAKNDSHKRLTVLPEASYAPEEVVSFRWRWKGVPSEHPDFVALKIVCKWLGNKVFNQLIYQEQLGYRLKFHLADQRTEESILFSMKIHFRDYERIQAIWRDLPETLEYEAVDLNIAKSHLSANLILSLRTQADFSYSMARLEFLGLPFDLHREVQAKLNSIEFETLNRVYQTYIRNQTPDVFFERKETQGKED